MLKDIIVDRHQQKIVDSVTYFYDVVRSKWLSVGRCNVTYGINHRNINSSRWLSVAHGIYSNNIGFKTPKTGTITTAVIQVKNPTSCKFTVMEDVNVTPILTMGLINEVDKTIDLDVDFDEGVSLRCYIEIIDDNVVDYPFVVLECASRV